DKGLVASAWEPGAITWLLSIPIEALDGAVIQSDSSPCRRYCTSRIAPKHTELHVQPWRPITLTPCLSPPVRQYGTPRPAALQRRTLPGRWATQAPSRRTARRAAPGAGTRARWGRAPRWAARLAPPAPGGARATAGPSRLRAHS